MNRGPCRETRLSTAVACHPSRLDRAAELARQLDAEVVLDPDPAGPPSAWRTMRLAWLRTPGWATHRLVVQDDAVPVAGAADLARVDVDTAPGLPVAFYVGVHHSLVARLVVDAELHGLPFAVARPSSGWLPTVATAMPVGDALDMVATAEREGWGRLADDEILGRWCRLRDRSVLVRVPSIFDHDDVVESIVNQGRWSPRRAVRLHPDMA